MTEQPKTVTILESEYLELKKGYDFYIKQKEIAAEKGRRSASKLTPEQRSERARKAVEARIAKYGQNKRK